MFNILQTQLYRLKKSKLFWAMFGVSAGLPLVSMLLMKLLFSVIGYGYTGEFDSGFSVYLEIQTGVSFLAVAGLNSFGDRIMLLAIICSSIFLSGEFSGGAIRNMVIANKSRTQIFWSFLSVAMIIGVSYYGVAYVSTLFFYGVGIGFGDLSATQILSGCLTSLFLGLLSVAVVQTCVCMFLFCTRKTGATIAFPLLIMILVPGTVETVITIVTTIKSVFGETIDYNTLSWIPTYNMVLFDPNELDGALVGKIVLYNAPLAALFGSMSWLALHKADLK